MAIRHHVATAVLCILSVLSMGGLCCGVREPAATFVTPGIDTPSGRLDLDDELNGQHDLMSDCTVGTTNTTLEDADNNPIQTTVTIRCLAGDAAPLELTLVLPDLRAAQDPSEPGTLERMTYGELSTDPGFVDPPQATISVTLAESVGTKAAHPAIVTDDFRRVVDVAIAIPAFVHQRISGDLAVPAVTGTLRFSQQASHYRAVPRSLACDDTY